LLREPDERLTHPRSFAHGAVLATFVASAPAAAQGWEEYGYPDDAFSVASPAYPRHNDLPGRRQPVGLSIYSVRQANVVFATCTPQSEMTDNTARKK
jgi:hypothetical protein